MPCIEVHSRISCIDLFFNDKIICSFDGNGTISSCLDSYHRRLQRIPETDAGIKLKRLTSIDNGKYFIQVAVSENVTFHSSEVVVQVKTPGCEFYMI